MKNVEGMTMAQMVSEIHVVVQATKWTPEQIAARDRISAIAAEISKRSNAMESAFRAFQGTK